MNLFFHLFSTAIIALILSGCGIGLNLSKQQKKELRIIKKLPILLTASYSGTQNGTQINLRNNNKFDLFWHSAFGTSHYFGTWIRSERSDTVELSYNGLRPSGFDSILVYTKPMNRTDSTFCNSENLIHLSTINSEPIRILPFCIYKNEIFE